MWLLAGKAVDPLAQQVSVAKVPRVLLDQVQVKSAQRVGALRPEGVAELVRCHDLPGPGAVCPEGLQVDDHVTGSGQRRPGHPSTIGCGCATRGWGTCSGTCPSSPAATSTTTLYLAPLRPSWADDLRLLDAAPRA